MTIITISLVIGTYYPFMKFPDADVRERFFCRSPDVHRLVMSVIHHGVMDTMTAPSKLEALACAGASVILGAYIASSAENLLMQVVLLSLPPAALLVAIHRTRHTTQEDIAAVRPVLEPSSFDDVTAGLEFDILSRAS